MIYVYDSIPEKGDTTFKRYGVNYKLERRFKMGNHNFWSFVHPGYEKILLVPDFAVQYREVEKKFLKFGQGKKLEDFILLIKRYICRIPVVEDMPDEDSKTGIAQHITCDYKDIQVTFDFRNNELIFSKEFEIMDNNVFGNGIVVLMDMDMEH